MEGNGSAERNDRALHDAVQWNLGVGREQMRDVLWRCEALRAGKLYERTLFGTKEEAEGFVARMRECEPDQMFKVEAIKASAVWN